jgi:hypothetical protein
MLLDGYQFIALKNVDARVRMQQAKCCFRRFWAFDAEGFQAERNLFDEIVRR